MKKLFFMAALLAATLCATAQQNQVVWHNGKVMYGSPIPTVDSITFAAEIEASDTLHLILPRTIIVHDTVIKEVVVEVHDTIYQCPPADPDAPLAGVFSVAADKQVKFSKGNLQYTQSTDTWSIADNQYDMLGTANVVDGELADKIDLFGWSGSTATAKWGVSTSQNNEDYSGDFADWGQNIGDGNTPDGSGQGWRTLTNDEWEYLRSSRANAASLMGVARINFDAEGTTYANGLILLPDSWTCPDGITFTTAMESYDNNTFTLEQWQKVEAAGAVFLPASGSRYGSSINNVQSRGDYWSASPTDSRYAFCLYFRSDEADWGDYSRYGGRAVRLVQDL